MLVDLEVDNIKSIMAENIESVLERGEKLDTLELKAEELSFAAKEFMKAVSDIAYCFTEFFTNIPECFNIASDKVHNQCLHIQCTWLYCICGK